MIVTVIVKLIIIDDHVDFHLNTRVLSQNNIISIEIDPDVNISEVSRCSDVASEDLFSEVFKYYFAFSK